MTLAHTSPLFNTTSADVVVCSSDGIQFRLHKLILSLASPIFRDMFTLPTNPDTILVPIDVTETASTLEDLLRFCYPMEPPELLGLCRHRLVLEAARKYEMEFIARPLNNRLRNFLPTEAMRVYCLAYKYEDGELAQAAARQLLLQPRFFDTLHPPPEFDELPITALAKLMAYREQSATAAAAVLLDDRWMMTGFRGHAMRVSKKGNIVPSEPSKAGWTWLTCQSCREGNSSMSLEGTYWLAPAIRPRSWWETYRDSCVKEIPLFLRPLPSVVTERHLIRPALESAARCKTCEPKAAAELSEYAEAVAKRIEADVAKITIDFPFTTRPGSALEREELITSVEPGIEFVQP